MPNRIACALAAAAATLLTHALGAAPRVFAGAGMGVGTVSKLELRRVQAPGLLASGRLGVGLSPKVAVLLEAEAHHVLADGRPGSFDLLVPSSVYGTWIALLSAQLELGRGFFVRPGLGFGRQRFALGADCDPYGATCARAYTSAESGPAVGLAVGYRRALGRAASLALEGLARSSGGEDSSSGRRLFGVQLALQLGR